MDLDLLGAVNDLRQAILTRYADLNGAELTTSVWIFEGFDGIQRGVHVLSENRDTT